MVQMIKVTNLMSMVRVTSGSNYCPLNYIHILVPRVISGSNYDLLNYLLVHIYMDIDM